MLADCSSWRTTESAMFIESIDDVGRFDFDDGILIALNCRSDA